MAWIKILTSQGDHAEALQRLTTAAEKFRNLPPDAARVGFGPVAAEFSEDTDTRYQGGDLGWLADAEFAARYPAPLVQATKTLQIGQPSVPIALADGVCLLLIAQERPPTPLSPEILKERVKQELITTRRAEAKANFRRTARTAVTVEIRNEVLEKSTAYRCP